MLRSDKRDFATKNLTLTRVLELKTLIADYDLTNSGKVYVSAPKIGQ